MQLPDPPRPSPFERLLNDVIMFRGLFVIAWNRVRKVLGLSHYSTRDPWVAGQPSPCTHLAIMRSLGIPAWHEGPWAEVGRIQCRSGRLVFTDPGEFPTLKPYLGVVAKVPVGTHRLELQRVKLARGYGACVLRARLVWEQIGEPDFLPLGAVGIDLAMLSIGDYDETARILGRADYKHDPFRFRPSDQDYAATDPLGGDNRFLHVFKTGMGSGLYPVLLMANAGKPCGIFVEMTGLLDANGSQAIKTSTIYRVRMKGRIA